MTLIPPIVWRAQRRRSGARYKDSALAPSSIPGIKRYPVCLPAGFGNVINL
jgi:hypothetical protein